MHVANVDNTPNHVQNSNQAQKIVDSKNQATKIINYQHYMFLLNEISFFVVLILVYGES